MKVKLVGFLIFCLMGSKIFAQQTSKDFFERGTIKYHLEDYKAAIIDFDQGKLNATSGELQIDRNAFLTFFKAVR